MIPFIHIPDAHLGPLTIHPFGVLVAIAVLIGTSLASWRARRLGVDASDLGGFVGCVMALGFIGGHVIDAILYRPADVLARPLHLLAIWDGQGSFGGFIGAALGALGWKYLERSRSRSGIPWVRLRAAPRPILPLADVLLSVFPIAWIFGRMGCAVAHDHPGARTSADAIFAVAYGPADAAHVWHGPLGVELRNGSAPRYDLGLLECMLAVVIGLAVMVSWRRRWPVGTYVAAVPLAYAPVRFALDFLRVADADGGDARYAGLTPAQWSCVALAAFSTWMLARTIRSARAPSATAELTGREAPVRRRRARGSAR